MKNIKLSKFEVKKPLAVDSEGNFLTLKELEEKRPYLGLATLSRDQQRDLVLKRYEIEPDFKISIVGGEIIDKAQLEKEIAKETDLGDSALRAELSYLSDIHAELAGEAAQVEAPERTIDLGPWPPEEYKWIPKKWLPIFLRRCAVFAEDTDTAITESAADYRKKIVIPCFKREGIHPIILTGSDDTRPNFASACKRWCTIYISGVGHGSPTSYTGYRHDRLWEECKYDPREVRGKIIHLLSCKTAQRLGPDLVKKGACAYFGYFENFTITWNHPRAFWKCDSTIDLAFCHGLNAEQAAKLALRVYNYWIARMREIHGPTAVWLTWDRDALRTPLHGRQYGDKRCHLRRLPFFMEMETQMAEEKLAEIEEIAEEVADIDDIFAQMTK